MRPERKSHAVTLAVRFAGGLGHGDPSGGCGHATRTAILPRDGKRRVVPCWIARGRVGRSARRAAAVWRATDRHGRAFCLREPPRRVGLGDDVIPDTLWNRRTRFADVERDRGLVRQCFFRRRSLVLQPASPRAARGFR